MTLFAICLFSWRQVLAYCRQNIKPQICLLLGYFKKAILRNNRVKQSLVDNRMVGFVNSTGGQMQMERPGRRGQQSNRYQASIPEAKVLTGNRQRPSRKQINWPQGHLRDLGCGWEFLPLDRTSVGQPAATTWGPGRAGKIDEIWGPRAWSGQDRNQSEIRFETHGSWTSFIHSFWPEAGLTPGSGTGLSPEVGFMWHKQK